MQEWVSLVFHCHRGFSPVISRAFRLRSRLNGYLLGKRTKPLKTVHHFLKARADHWAKATL